MFYVTKTKECRGKKIRLSFPLPWEFQTPISSSRVLDPSLLLRDPRLLINLPRNWLSHNQKLFEKVNILIWLFMFFSQKQRITNLRCPKFSCEIVLEGNSERITNIFWIHGRIFIKTRIIFQGDYFDDQQLFDVYGMVCLKVKPLYLPNWKNETPFPASLIPPLMGIKEEETSGLRIYWSQ